MVNECIAKTEPFDTELFAHKALAVYEQTLMIFRRHLWLKNQNG